MALQFFTFAAAANANYTCQLINDRQVIISLLYASNPQLMLTYHFFGQNRATKIISFVCFLSFHISRCLFACSLLLNAHLFEV